jgi:hypothetical protein
MGTLHLAPHSRARCCHEQRKGHGVPNWPRQDPNPFNGWIGYLRNVQAHSGKPYTKTKKQTVLRVIHCPDREPGHEHKDREGSREAPGKRDKAIKAKSLFTLAPPLPSWCPCVCVPAPDKDNELPVVSVQPHSHRLLKVCPLARVF